MDDNRDVAQAMAMLLELRGYEVAIGLSGREALELYPRLSPRVVFLDIGMEEMDGFEAARLLRGRQPDPSRLLLVAVSGYDDAAFRTASRQAGFDCHLTKPVDPASLSAVLESVA